MKLPPARPEDRRRTAEGPPWPDTLPGWRRSEAFAEDLAEPLPAGLAASGREVTPPRPTAPRPGLALVLALFGR
jgi:hypothetical protein